MQIQILFFLVCGILFVNGSPLETVATVVSNDTADSDEPIEPLKTKEANESSPESPDSLESVESAEALEEIDNTLTVDEVESAIDDSKISDGTPVLHISTGIVSMSVFQSLPIPTDNVLRKIGPVELGLQNVVSASAAATEETYLEMTTLNAKISHMINSKSEILTAHAMNALFKPLNKVESEIKKTEACGKRYESALNMVFKDIDLTLKQCTKNLTAIDERFRSANVGTLTSLSLAAEEMNKLPETCEIAHNFAVGTFCVVNNLAETNERVLANVRAIKESTDLAKKETAEAVKNSQNCQNKLVDSVTEKLTKLLKEIDQKCVERKS